jgi:diguanylate cyclase (GGDEF)-like protein
MIVEPVFNIMIPHNLSNDPVKMTYAKNFVSACIVSIFASPIYILLYYLLHDHAASCAVLTAEIIMLSSLFILKYLRSLFFATTIFITALTSLLIWLAYHQGGIYSATAYWLILPPLVAVFISGIKSGFFWCAVSIVAISIFYLMKHHHFHFPASSITDPLLLQYLAICGLIIIIIWLIYFYETVKNANLEKLQYIAYHDPLTGLPNLSAYNKLLENAVIKSRKNRVPFAIFYIDIDNFRKINDIFGHDIGDFLLKEIVIRVKRYILLTNTMARISEDKFKIIFEKDMDQAEITEMANILLIALKAPFTISKHEIQITASIGIAVFPVGPIHDVLIDRYVEVALFKAKYLGGNNFQYFTEDLEKEEDLRVEIERHLSNAITNEELYLNFQPQFDPTNPEKITGLEALLRWNSAILGDVPSSLFIPVAEKNNIISQLGEWVLRKACQQYTQWIQMDLIDKNMPLAINVSVHQLYNESFLPSIEKIIQETGIPSYNLELELTETTIITDQAFTINMLEKLRGLGVRTVIDDFGAGSTSLSYLTTLPISGLKLDKSFIDTMLDTTDTSSIIESLIELAHRINLKVIAEGIENIDQLHFLQKIHCDHVQGYYLSKPLDVIAMQSLLASSRDR